VEITKRPLLAQHADPQTALEKLMQSRELMYRKAAATVHVATGESKEEVLRKVIAAVRSVHVV
jgi:shikimate kinase